MNQNYYDNMLTLRCDMCSFGWCMLENYMEAINPDARCPVWCCGGVLIVWGLKVIKSRTKAPTWIPRVRARV